MSESSPCPSRVPFMRWTNESGRHRGTCKCGFEGWVQSNGKLFPHHRPTSGFKTPSITEYSPLYEPVSFMILCQECGTIVGDEDIHNEWHNSVLDDLNLLRIKLQKLTAEPTEEVATEPA